MALADMFRDTELQATDVDYIASTLLAAGFSSAQARAILFDEVAPVFGKNLVSVAGNWTGWSDEFVVREVRAYLAQNQRVRWRRLFSLQGLAGAWVKRNLKMDWGQIQQRMDTASRAV